MIKEKAYDLGFSFCGVAKAEYLADQAPRLEKWLKAGMHGEMAYLADNFDKRLDPRKLFPGTKSVVSLLYNYYTNLKPQNHRAPRVSLYAYGKDYHRVLKKKLALLLDHIRNEIGDVSGRAFVDSAPILERAWAARSGLGWLGKNATLINRQQGSFFFLSELLLDLELEYDRPGGDFCADCRLCIDACPTGAIVEPHVIDARKCISYVTIESKGDIPPELAGRLGNWLFGCDICQEVCPFNQQAIPHQEPQFAPRPELLRMTANQWREMTEVQFKELFQGSVVKRTGYDGLKRNLAFLKRESAEDG